MVRRNFGSSMAACGIVMVLFSISALPAQGAMPAPVRMAPSPRPALAQDQRSDDALVMGHITGTVIDLNSGAPAANVAVNVGGVVVQSDANGNYDHWLPVGTYTVALALADGQGTSAQDVMTVVVLADVATVQHLNFHSQPAAAPTAVAAQPAVIPTAVAAQPAVAPTAMAGSAAGAAVDPSSVAPNRLPVTSESGNAAWLWLGFGMALLLAGSLVGFGPGRSPAMLVGAQAANSALLRGLLAAPAPVARPTTPRARQASADLLASLLAVDRRERDGDS